MKKNIFRLATLLLTVLVFLCCFPARVEAVGEEQSYSYNFDLENNALPAPDPYEVRYRIDPISMGLGRLKNPSGLFVKDNDLYLCDTGNNRIIQMTISASEATLVRIIEGTEEWTLSGPEDIFVHDNGDLYISDTGNQRIIWADSELNVKKFITRPDATVYESFKDFKPSKLVVTGGDRIYVQANGVNRGLMEFDENGEFVGFMGASSVTFAWEDYIWKLISTDAQKSQMESFTPTEYNNVALDPKGLLFVTTSTFEMADMWAGKANPVRRLNLKGSDILIRNYGNVHGAPTYGDEGPSRFKDVTVLDNYLYFALDTTRNRIYAYDQQGRSLYVFGGYGTRSGYFKTPTALEHWGRDLLVLDSGTGLITVLKPTTYGSTVMQAIEAYDCGNYEESYECWQEVLRLNGNCIMAYDGIGKIMLRNGDYTGALDYLEYAFDRYYYSKAFGQYRKDWIETYLIWIILAVVAFVVIRLVIKIYNKERGALEEYEERKRRFLEKQGQ